jgi:hypothetical protein
MDKYRNEVLNEIIDYNDKLIYQPFISEIALEIQKYTSEEIMKFFKMDDDDCNLFEFFLLDCYEAKLILENMEINDFANIENMISKTSDTTMYLNFIKYLKDLVVIADYFTYRKIETKAYKYYLAYNDVINTSNSIRKCIDNINVREDENRLLKQSFEENIILSSECIQSKIINSYETYLEDIKESYKNNDFSIYSESIFSCILEKLCYQTYLDIEGKEDLSQIINIINLMNIDVSIKRLIKALYLRLYNSADNAAFYKQDILNSLTLSPFLR